MKFTAVGDAIIQRRIFDDYKGFDELSPFINQGDAKFFNLETTLNKTGDACGSAFSGGTYLRANPHVLDDLKKFGFNMTSFNNNHVLDFSYAGFECTLGTVENSGLIHSGAGRNLAEASAPKYLETKNGRVALIAVNTTFDNTAMAGEQSPLFPGRPGINGLRIQKHIELPKEDLEYIKNIAAVTRINIGKEIVTKEGYYPELSDNEAELGGLKFVLGDKPRVVMEINKKDIARVEKTICEAKFQADYVIVSIHSHEIDGTKKEDPAKFLIDFAHHCIDIGANAIVGHGPHLLRPIEVYKNSPIFYSLGDFILQLYSVEAAPEDFFAKHGLDSSHTVYDLLKKRSKDFTVGLMTDKKMFRSVIPCWETNGTELTKITLLPIELSMDGNKSEIGLPRYCDNPEIAEYLADMCRSFGTKIERNSDGTLSCTW